ncbi:hypothetical protein [Phenylobacterium sp.]|uniref:hypothetical protein n=1 Tax=Phenylobacterium sp. TaxID=1871053 RepID=UPI0035B114E4
MGPGVDGAALMDGARLEAADAERGWKPLPTLLSALLMAALWLATHGYKGVFHDARLYTLQALHGLDPGRWAEDLFFKFGSQDSFTLFSAAFEPLVRSLGPALANIIGWLAGGALWMAGLFVLASAALDDRRLRLAAMIGVVAIEAHYGGFNVFRYGEPFLTPRLYAEALSMAALGFALRGRLVLAVLAIAAAGLLHPLMALVGAGALFFYSALADRRVWLLAALGAVVGAGLVLAGVEPFARVSRVYDPSWFQIVYDRCRFAFISRWSLFDHLRVVTTFAVLLAAQWRAEGKLRRLIRAVIMLTVAGLAVSFVGSDLARDVLIVNLQVWRVLWLATLFANGALAVLAFGLPKGMVSRELFLIAAVAGALAVPLWIPSFAVWGVALTACLALAAEARWGETMAPTARTALRLACRAVAIGLLAFSAIFVVLQTRSEQFPGRLADLVATLAVIGVAWAASRLAARRLAFGLAALLCVAVFARLDHRTDWQRFLEAPGAPADLARFVGPARNIYWEGGPEVLWLKLRRPSYYSCLQGAGAMFYRQTATTFHARLEALKGLGSREVAGGFDRFCAFKGMPPKPSPPTREALAATCRRLPDLDELVLVRAAPGLAARSWAAPTSEELPGRNELYPSERVSRFYAYDCKDFR